MSATGGRHSYLEPAQTRTSRDHIIISECPLDLYSSSRILAYLSSINCRRCDVLIGECILSKTCQAGVN